MQTNISLREYAKKNGVSLWRVADALGISEPTMTRKLRYELSDADKGKMRSVIDSIVNSRA